MEKKPRYRVLLSPLNGELPSIQENETYKKWCEQRGSKISETRTINDGSLQFNYFVKL
jgi:hypothetical protein